MPRISKNHLKYVLAGLIIAVPIVIFGGMIGYLILKYNQYQKMMAVSNPSEIIMTELDLKAVPPLELSGFEQYEHSGICFEFFDGMTSKTLGEKSFSLKEEKTEKGFIIIHYDRVPQVEAMNENSLSIEEFVSHYGMGGISQYEGLKQAYRYNDQLNYLETLAADQDRLEYHVIMTYLQVGPKNKSTGNVDVYDLRGDDRKALVWKMNGNGRYHYYLWMDDQDAFITGYYYNKSDESIDALAKILNSFCICGELEPAEPILPEEDM